MFISEPDKEINHAFIIGYVYHYVLHVWVGGQWLINEENSTSMN